jgi:two-component system LytT family sensor kinase
LKRGALRFAILAGALALPAVVISAQLYAAYRLRGLRVSFSGGLAIQLIHWELWTFLGPLVWSLERRWPLTSSNRPAMLVRHAVAAPVVAVFALALNLLGYHALIRLPGSAAWFTGFDRSVLATTIFYFVSYFHVELLIYGVIVAAAHAVRTTVLLRAKEHDTLRLEAELTGAKLTALRMQLQPHFLFNTLHTISSLVLQRRNDEAVTLLAELGELLRGTLAQRDTELAPLNDELAHLKRYLRIEEARFGDRLRIDWNVEPAAMDALIPPFILQPLVENAFRHGIARQTDRAVLTIAASADNGFLRISIDNDGPPLAEAFTIDAARGYGLKNVVQRLQTRSPSGRLELHNTATGVRATLVLPRWDADARGAT